MRDQVRPAACACASPVSTSAALVRYRGRLRPCSRDRSVRLASFFGRSDAEQWLADDGQEGSDDAGGAAGGAFDVSDAFAAISSARRGLEFFKTEMDKPEEDIDLLASACYVAMHRSPGISVDDVRHELDKMAKLIEAQLPPVEERFPLRTIKTISRVFAGELAFRGNIENYYEVENSCIDEVLKRKTGIPITLCLVYMELAARVGVRMVEVSIPGHLLCRPVGESESGMEILVDAFNLGDTLFIEEVENILSRNSMLSDGQKVQIERTFLEQRDVAKKAFLTRMLGNLKGIYDSREDFASALRITEYMMVCNPYKSLEVPLVRTLGLNYFRCGRWIDAIETLESYLIKAEGSSVDTRVDEEVNISLDTSRRILALERDVLSAMEDSQDV